MKAATIMIQIRGEEEKEGIKEMIILSNQAVVIIRSSTSPIIIIRIMASRMNRLRSERSYPAVAAAVAEAATTAVAAVPLPYYIHEKVSEKDAGTSDQSDLMTSEHPYCEPLSLLFSSTYKSVILRARFPLPPLPASFSPTGSPCSSRFCRPPKTFPASSSERICTNF